MPPGQHQMVPQDSMPMSGSTLSLLPGESSNSSAPLLVDTVLSFIKAFYSKGDIEFLKMLVKERFSPNEVEVC